MSFDSETVATMKAVLDEMCAHLPLSDNSTRTRVAVMLVERAKGQHCSIDELRYAARLGLQASL